MLHIYRNIKNKKLQTNIIHLGQDLKQTNMIYDYKNGYIDI